MSRLRRLSHYLVGPNSIQFYSIPIIVELNQINLIIPKLFPFICLLSSLLERSAMREISGIRVSPKA